jgi:hypothetical protein
MGADVDTIIIGTALEPWKTHHDDDCISTEIIAASFWFLVFGSWHLVLSI